MLKLTTYSQVIVDKLLFIKVFQIIFLNPKIETLSIKRNYSALNIFKKS